jgi:SWI/SNF-related matrix-associated actin-dependent regulator 1 of chromatin subfamily A
VRQARGSEPSGARLISAEYKAQVVAWYLSSGKTLADVAASLNLSESMLREWVWHASLDDVSDEAPAPLPDLAAQDADNSSTHGRVASSKARNTARALARAEKKAAEALAREEAAAEAEASARADAAVAREEARTAYAAAVEAIVSAEVAAAEAVAQAEAAAREEIAAAYAAAVEAMVRAEVAAGEKVARAEALAAEAVVEAKAARAEALAAKAVAEAKAVAQSETISRLETEAAARGEVATAYASAMEAVVRVESLAAEALAQGQVAPKALAHPEPPAAVVEPEVVQVAKALRVSSRPAEDRAEDEAAARAEIAQLVSRLAPVELWVHTTGRTLAEARAAALEQLGVDEAQAEIEVLSDRSRWLPGRIQIRARVRVGEAARS